MDGLRVPVVSERDEVVRRYAQLQMAEWHLKEALPGIAGMPTAHEAVKRALRIVSRQAGKALAKVKEAEDAELKNGGAL